MLQQLVYNIFMCHFIFPDTHSKDCIHWGLLPIASAKMKANAKLAKGYFTGDPSYETEHVELKITGEGQNATEEEEVVSMNLIF